MCARDFAERYGFELPPAPIEGDIELNFDGADYG